MNCEIGDVVQIDGGLVIVTAVKGDRASVAAISDFKGKKPHALEHGINPEISKDRLFERRGATGLAMFFKEQNELKTGKKKGLIKLEPGDLLCYEGRLCTVTAVDEKTATLGDLDGNVWQDERWLNQIFFQDCTCHQLFRLDAEARAENLKQFLAQRKSPSPEAETSDTTETPHIETMSTKKSTKKVKKANKSRAAAAPVATKARSGEWFGFSTNSVLVAAGAAGIAVEQAVKVATKHKVSVDEKKFKRVLAYGKAKGGGAALSAEQLAEFKA